MSDERIGNWFLTFTGRQFWPQSPRVEDIDIEDIGQGLSNVCRFGGQCRSFYSVAQHSVLVSRLVPPALAFEGLMHDAPEAYIGDMVRPMKHDPGMSQYRESEDRIWRVVAERFELPGVLSSEVKHADNVALMTERRDLMAKSVPWNIRATPHPDKVTALGPEAARFLFMERYRELVRL